MKLHTKLSLFGLSLSICLLLGITTNIYAFTEIYFEIQPVIEHGDVPNPNVLIVLDPGHGGYDKGCSGAKRHEKDVNLEIARKLKEYLERTSTKFEVILTRESDQFISLEKRIEIANHKEADLFISVHCNSLPHGHASGSETHVAGLDFVNANQNDYLKRHNFIDPTALAKIKRDQLSQAEKMLILKNSLDLAALVSNSLGKHLPYKSRGVKESGFTVLKYLKMPGVLVEAGFLSNSKQEAYMSTSEGIHQIANSLATAVENYVVHNKLEEEKQLAYERFMNEIQIVKEFSETTYSIELLLTKDKPLLYYEPRWDKLESIYVVKKGDFYHYRTGYFTNMKAAQNVIPTLLSIGFENPKIIDVPPKK